MKNLKTFAVALVIMISGSSFASKEKPTSVKTNNSSELSNLLNDQALVLDKDYLGKVIFLVNEEKKIVVHAVLSKGEFVRDYINSKLSAKVLKGG